MATIYLSIARPSQFSQPQHYFYSRNRWSIGQLAVYRSPPLKPTTSLLSSSSSSTSTSVSVVAQEEEEEEEEKSSSSSDDLSLQSESTPSQDSDSFSIISGCKACGREEIEKGCNGQGRIQGGIATVPGFGWWPIKAYRPCPGFVASGGRYRRQGQTIDEVAFGRSEKVASISISTDEDPQSRKKKQSPKKLKS